MCGARPDLLKGTWDRPNRSKQCTAVATRASQNLGCICGGIASRNRDRSIPLCSELVRPHLECRVQLRSLQFEKDVDRLDRVQRKVTELVKGLKNLPCEERLKELGFFCQEKKGLERPSSQYYSS